MKDNTIITINGLSIKANSVYKITNKPDINAPSGFVKEGTTKLPSSGIGNSVPCRFIITNKSKGTGIFDTGLFEQSPCYSTLSSEKAKIQVNILKDSIVKPYEKKYSKGVLDHQNEDFWKEFGVDLFEGRYFVTSNVDDLLELYIAMSGFELTPKDELGNPQFNESQYCIEDKAKVQTIKDERANDLMSVITNFGVMLDKDRTTLLNILRYIKLIGVTGEIDKNTLNSMFYEWLNKSTENPKKFKKTFDLTQSEETRDVVNLYVIVSKLANKGIISRLGGEYNYRGEPLGADLKTVAHNLNSKKELGEIKIELLEEE